MCSQVNVINYKNNLISSEKIYFMNTELNIEK